MLIHDPKNYREYCTFSKKVPLQFGYKKSTVFEFNLDTSQVLSFEKGVCCWVVGVVDNQSRVVIFRPVTVLQEARTWLLYLRDLSNIPRGAVQSWQKYWWWGSVNSNCFSHLGSEIIIIQTCLSFYSILQLSVSSSMVSLPKQTPPLCVCRALWNRWRWRWFLMWTSTNWVTGARSPFAHTLYIYI